MGKRFFAVDILAGIDGLDRLNSVPVVRRGYTYGIDVLAIDNLAVVVVRLAVVVLVTLVGPITSGVAAGGVTVGNRNSDNAGIGHESVLQTAVLNAHADETNGNLVVWLYLGRQDAGRQDERGAGNCGRLEETAS